MSRSIEDSAPRFWLGTFLTLFLFVKSEVLGLLAQQALRLVGQILSGFDGFLTREIERGFSGKGLDSAQPAL